MLPVVQAFPHKLNTDDWICSTVTAHIQKKTVEKTKQKKIGLKSSENAADYVRGYGGLKNVR